MLQKFMIREILLIVNFPFMDSNTVEPPNSGRVGNFDDVPYSVVEP